MEKIGKANRKPTWISPYAPIKADMLRSRFMEGVGFFKKGFFGQLGGMRGIAMNIRMQQKTELDLPVIADACELLVHLGHNFVMLQREKYLETPIVPDKVADEWLLRPQGKDRVITALDLLAAHNVLLKQDDVYKIHPEIVIKF